MNIILKNIKDYNETNKTKLNFEKLPLPLELFLTIFSQLNSQIGALRTLCYLNKQWHQIINQSNLWKTAIYNEIAFGNEKWAKIFGPEVVEGEDLIEEFSSIPWEALIADCAKFQEIINAEKNFYPPKAKAIDILMLVRLPKKLNGGLTLKTICQLAKKRFPDKATGYRIYGTCLNEELLKDKSIEKSQWVVMQKFCLPESNNKSYEEEQQMVADLTQPLKLSGYGVPETLKFVTCLFVEYLCSKSTFLREHGRFVRAKENLYPHHASVSNRADGLWVGSSGDSIPGDGVMLMREF